MTLAIGNGLRRRQVVTSQVLPRAQLALLFAALLGGVLLPILIFRMPFMADYPNHLARMYATGALDHDPLLSRYYEIDWRLVPDLAADAVVPALATAIGIFAAGKLFVALTLALLATGTIAVHHALYRRIGLWSLTAFLFLYNSNFFYGLLNYLFATALALWGTAAWIWLRDRGPLLRAGVSWLFAVALFFSHFLGVGVYGMAIGCYELWRWRATRPRARHLLRDGAVLLLPFVLLVPLTLASPTVDFAQQTEWAFWPDKVLGLYLIFKSYNREAAIALALVVGAAALWGLLTRRLRPHPAGMVFAALAALVYLAMPTKLMSASLVDTRLPATFLLVFIGMSDWEHRGAGEARRFAATLVALIVLVLVGITATWTRYQTVMAQFEQSFSRIPPGSRMLVAVNGRGTDRTDGPLLLHLPALAVIERSVLYSHAFTHPAKQPLQLKAPYRDSAPYDGMPLPVEELAVADGDGSVVVPPQPGNTDLLRPYWTHWRRDYDYLYVLYTPRGYQPPLTGLEPLDRTDVFSLYRIERAP